MRDMNRRTLLGAALAGWASGTARADEPYGTVTQGVETWSESLMLIYFDRDVRNGISVRVSRYPDLNATWIWCHVLFEGQIYAYTERRVSCSAQRNLPELIRGDYSAPSAGVAFLRKGSALNLAAIELSATVQARQSSEGRDGPGETPISIEAAFIRPRLKDNLPSGRSEWTGWADIALNVDGKRIQLSGAAKAHEQVQTAPRFDAPFTYAMLWNDETSFIATAAARRRSGDFEADGISTAVTDFRPTAPGRERLFDLRLENGRVLTGRASRVAAYDVPIFGRMWNGAIVRAVIEGRSMLGMLNDWRPEDNTFL
ncbi:MAG: hypothetical protein KGS00_04940 [Alphaproteobacteria bacterium]|nr:hypothetical protein [Alphaproteobacteria bacterium]